MFPEVIEVGGIPSIDNVLDMMIKFDSQIDFANSLAINRTAEDVQGYAVNVLLPGKLTIRRPWLKPRTRFGVNINPSNKRNLEAKVFSRAPWLELQETGGSKSFNKPTPGQGASLVLVPRQDIRQTQDRLVPRKLSPAKLLKDPKKNKVFWIGENLWQRIGPGEGDIEPLFFGAPQTHIGAALTFVTSSKEIVQGVYKHNWGKALAFAIATAKGNLSQQD